MRNATLEPPGISVSYGAARLVSCLVLLRGLACANQQEQKRLWGCAAGFENGSDMNFALEHWKA